MEVAWVFQPTSLCESILEDVEVELEVEVVEDKLDACA